MRARTAAAGALSAGCLERRRRASSSVLAANFSDFFERFDMSASLPVKGPFDFASPVRTFS